MEYNMYKSVKGEVEKVISSIEASLGNGFAKDYPEYRYLSGQIVALKGIRNYIDDRIGKLGD